MANIILLHNLSPGVISSLIYILHFARKILSVLSFLFVEISLSFLFSFSILATIVERYRSADADHLSMIKTNNLDPELFCARRGERSRALGNVSDWFQQKNNKRVSDWSIQVCTRAVERAYVSGV